MAKSVYKATIDAAGNDYYIATSPSGHAQALDAKSDRGTAASPLELLLMSVAGCTAVDVESILAKKRQEITAYRVEIEGMRRDELPRGFIEFRIHHIVYGRSVSEKAVADAISLSEEKYCSVAFTVRPTATIISTFEIIEVE